ncbi:MAG TPA: hypothetical protein VFZ79_11370 [Acidimicrobiales bacterium]
MPDTTSADRRRDLVGHLGSDGGARDDWGAGAPRAALGDLLGVRAGWRVLVIGASSGRTATLLAEAVGDRGVVTAVEADPDVAVAARRALVTGRVPALVEVGDGAAGWPAAAPFDAVVATVGVDRVPRAWFDQLRPGGRLLAPIRLSPVASRSDAVVTLRKSTSGFDQVAVMPGRVPPLRRPGDPDGARGLPARLVAGETDSCRGIWAGSTGYRGGNHVDDAVPGGLLVDLAGPALAGLDRGARQRLAVTAMGFGRSRRVRVGSGAVGGLLTYAALALPEQRLVEVSRAGGTGSAARRALGVVDAVDGGLAALAPDRPGGGVRLDAWGGRGAERSLLSAVERWMLAGRPGIGDARVTVRYGPVRPHGWWSVRRGDQWLALDWRRPG